jgi:antitoxin component YwqK of YwqJK toxin-antitoxin module
MKGNRIIMFLLPIALYACDYKKVKIQSRWEDGTKAVVFTYKNSSDTLTYLYESFYKNGQPDTKGMIINGKQDGLWEWWFENGRKKDEATLTHGLYIEQRKHWREDGTLQQIEIINDECLSDCCDGKAIYFDEKGVKALEYDRVGGQFNGEGNSFFKDGKIKTRFIYRDGRKTGMSQEFFENGQIHAEGNYVDDKEEGEWLFRDSLGAITDHNYYKHGKVVAVKSAPDFKLIKVEN